MAACPREPGNHSRSVQAAAASSWAYSAPLLRQSSRCGSRPRLQSTAVSVLSQRQQLCSPLRLTPHRRCQSATADPLEDCAAITPFLQLGCGPKKPLGPVQTCCCRCLPSPVLHWYRGKALLCPGCAES
ncbi:hypothetical protein NDU88_002845 [Pleurodeles waltl]|uniref:Uncharacterized protein n=1 Tax=Pleurodeles waltl TaxID=8319 RepID=A0AAV7M766_PLEWA|nr:hypothetical protein NDU88_002845 [Pleurodeles waltl]